MRTSTKLSLAVTVDRSGIADVEGECREGRMQASSDAVDWIYIAAPLNAQSPGPRERGLHLMMEVLAGNDEAGDSVTDRWVL